MTARIVAFILDFVIVSTPVLGVALMSVAMHRGWIQRDRILKYALILSLALTVIGYSRGRSLSASAAIERAAVGVPAIAAFLIIRQIGRTLAFRHRVSEREALADERWQSALRALTAEKLRLNVTSAVISPFSVGREICIPAWMPATLTDDQIKSVLAHEIDHLRQRDRWWVLLVDVCCAIFFLQPILFIIRREMESLVEQRADRAAAGAVGSGIPLAEVLYRIAKDATPQDAMPALALVRRRWSVASRVERLLKGSLTGRACAARIIAAHFVLAGTLASIIALALPSFGSR